VEEQELQLSETSDFESPPIPLEKALKRDIILFASALHLGQLAASSILLMGRSSSNLLSQFSQ
jgi:hypothetical protein